MNSSSLPSSAAPAPVRVLLLENIHKSAQETFAAHDPRYDFQIETRSASLDEASLIDALQGVQMVGIRSKTHITAKVLESAPSLLAVGCFCIGTNQVDLAAANRRGVPVFNAPFSNTRSVAELMVSEIIALARQISDRSREVHAGDWKKAAAGCYEVRGKTLGIIGYGHIGRQLGVLAEAVGLRVLYYDIAARLPMGNNRAVHSLEELLAQSDFVSLHVPGTPETHEMIREAEIASMKKGSYLLNASRGTVVVIPALAAALKSGHLAGAAVDVFPKEPASNSERFESELCGLSNVILTPHIGGSTEEAQEAIGREVANTLAKFATLGTTTGAVNFPQVEAPPLRSGKRILNVHRNVPGVLRDTNRIVTDLSANIDSQILATDANIGYVVMDLGEDVSSEVSQAIAALATSISTRVVS